MVIETTDPIIGIIVGPETETITEMAVGTIIDQIIEGMGSNQRYGNRNQDHSRSRERDRDRSSSRESSQSRSGNQSQNRNESRRQSRNNTRDRSESRSRSTSHVSTNRDRYHRCYRCNEYDHFVRECPNDVTDGSSDEMGGSLLRMLDPGQTYALNYADEED